MKQKIAVLTFAAVLGAVGIPRSYGQQRPQRSVAEKIAALTDALNNGVLTQQEYDAKVRALNAAPGAADLDAAPGTKRVAIDDPVLGVNYFTYTIPADWMFQGAMTHGTSCNVSTAPFLRASSPDGLTGIKVFPRADFTWSNNPADIPKGNSGCMAHEGEIKAADFLNYAVGLLHVEYVRDITDAAKVERMRNDLGQSNMPGNMRRTFADMASALTRFKINSINEEEQIDVIVHCWETDFPRRNTRDETCAVDSQLTWAPEGKVLSTVKTMQAMVKPTLNPGYMQRWAQNNAQQWAAIGQQMTNANNLFYQNLNRQIVANGQATRQQMDQQFQTHEAAMAAAQRGSDMNLQRQQQNWNAQQRMADDACDYALGMQKRLDPTTGQVYKSSSAYTYDWISADGKQHYPTNDINFNPNGMGTGNWTLTSNVH